MASLLKTHLPIGPEFETPPYWQPAWSIAGLVVAHRDRRKFLAARSSVHINEDLCPNTGRSTGADGGYEGSQEPR